MNCLQLWGCGAVFSQLVLLINVGWFRCINWDDVFPVNAATVDVALTRTNPVFTLAQSIVVNASQLFQPVEHCRFLFGVWINSVLVSKVDHATSIACLNQKIICLKRLIIGGSSSIPSIRSASGSTLSAMES